VDVESLELWEQFICESIIVMFDSPSADGMATFDEPARLALSKVYAGFQSFSEAVAFEDGLRSSVASAMDLSRLPALAENGGETEQPNPTESAGNMIEADMAAESRSLTPKICLNSHMTNLLQKHKDVCQSWSVERWQIELAPSWGKTPSKGGIHGTGVWKWLMKLRGESEAALKEKQTTKNQDGKRRANPF